MCPQGFYTNSNKKCSEKSFAKTHKSNVFARIYSIFLIRISIILKGVVTLISNDVFSTMYPMKPDRSAFPAELSLAIAYVPLQQLSAVYDDEVALQVGTLFPDLDKPFLMGRGNTK